MPWGDRTGPMGYGPRTGRRLGYCSGYSSPGYTKGPGMGRGWGRGRAWGWQSWGGDYIDPYYSPSVVAPPYPPAPITPNPEEESKYLDQTLTGLKKQIEGIEKRLAEIASEKKD